MRAEINFRFNGSNERGDGVTRYHFNDGAIFVWIAINEDGDVIDSALRQNCEAFRQLWNAAIAQKLASRPGDAPLFATAQDEGRS